MSRVLIWSTNYASALLVFAGLNDEGRGPGLRNLGMLHRDERLEALSAGDVWAHRSHTDSFSFAAAEAIATSLPVILTRHVNIASDAAAASTAIAMRADASELGTQLIRLLGDAGLRTTVKQPRARPRQAIRLGTCWH